MANVPGSYSTKNFSILFLKQSFELKMNAVSSTTALHSPDSSSEMGAVDSNGNSDVMMIRRGDRHYQRYPREPVGSRTSVSSSASSGSGSSTSSTSSNHGDDLPHTPEENVSSPDW